MEQILETDVLKVVIAVGPQLLVGDAIQYQGMIWIVAQWLESPDGEWRKPTRLICVANLQHQDLRDNPQRTADFAVNEPLPKELLEGKIAGQPNSKYIVVDAPPILLRKPKIY